MTLSAGSRLGPYEILAPLGAGGMGEVYRAKDPRLGRDVAIKVLPATFSQDADRLRRFEQEARAAGVLNHPNITSVFDIGSHDGAPYIVTELLEGETLRQRIATGPIPVRKATDYAVQIAKGLAAAHEKGIVHRDLKPENLFLTKDGRVKILDFGLAKLKAEREDGGQTDLQTVSGTQPGVVLGTMGYMSPEQVRGRPADRRSDLFAFGTILYEMLSGQKAFRGDTAADTITAILTKEPPDLSKTNEEVHPGLDRIVRHCLEKNPEERFESARDVAFDLEALSGLSAPTGTAAAAGLALPRRRGFALATASALALAAGLAAGMYVDRRLSRPEPPSFHQLTFRRGEIFSARFAPDGQTVIYTAAWDGKPMEIFFRRLESPESRPSGLAGAELLAVSPTGVNAVSLNRHAVLGFIRTGRLATVSVAGGVAPRELLDDVQEADWAPNGKDLAVVRSVGGRYRLEYPAGKVLYETTGWIGHPRVSRRGDLVAFCDHATPGDDSGTIGVVDSSGKKRTIPGDYASLQGLAWSPGDREIWFTAAEVGNRSLHAVTPGGKHRMLARVTGSLTLRDIASDGRLLLTDDRGRQRIIGLAPGETKERDLSWLDFSSARDLSADGTLLLFDESGEGGGEGYSVYIRKTDGSPATRLGEGAAARLSPDGKWALSGTGFGSAKPAVVAYPTGVGEPRRLPDDGLTVQMSDWLPDGKTLVLTASEPGHGTRLYLRPFDGGKAKAFSPEGYRSQRRGVSPDGKSVLVTGPDQRFYAYPVGGGEPTPLSDVTAQDRVEGWSADSKSVIVHRRSELPARIYWLDVATGQKRLWKELMPIETAGLGSVGGIVVTPDGRSYVYGTSWTLSDLYLVSGLK